MSEVTEKQLTDILAQFESAGQTDQAISICKRFLRKRDILTQPEAQQSATVHIAIMRKDRAALRDYSEFSQFPDIREMCSSLVAEFDAKSAPVSKWPSIW
jgi:hypothetical protein